MLEELKSYVNNVLALAKLEMVERLSATFSSFVYLALFLLLFFFVLLTFSFACCIWLGQWLEDYFLGSLIVVGFYLLSLVLVAFLRKRILKLLQNRFIKKVYSKDLTPSKYD